MTHRVEQIKTNKYIPSLANIAKSIPLLRNGIWREPLELLSPPNDFDPKSAQESWLNKPSELNTGRKLVSQIVTPATGLLKKELEESQNDPVEILKRYNIVLSLLQMTGINSQSVFELFTKVSDQQNIIEFIILEAEIINKLPKPASLDYDKLIEEALSQNSEDSEVYNPKNAKQRHNLLRKALSCVEINTPDSWKELYFMTNDLGRSLPYWFAEWSETDLAPDKDDLNFLESLREDVYKYLPKMLERGDQILTLYEFSKAKRKLLFVEGRLINFAIKFLLGSVNDYPLSNFDSNTEQMKKYLKWEQEYKKAEENHKLDILMALK